MRLKIGLVGGSGHMGQVIMELGRKYLPDSAFFSDKGAELADFITASDLLIDFSSAAHTKALLKCLIENPRPIIIGTTALDDEDHSLMDKIALEVPLLQDYNMSLGIHRMAQCLTLLSASMDTGEVIDLSDCHHAAKKDAPSGTSFKLAEALLKGKEEGYDPKNCFYTPIDGSKRNGKIGLSIQRRGNVFGEHNVTFTTENEEIILSHRAFNRSAFAKGALEAAKWLHSQPVGRYSMSHLL